MEEKREIKRGDIYYADLDPVIGSEQGGIRPVVIIQNDVGNKHSPTILIAPFTCKMRKKPLPTHVFINSADSGLRHNSMILFEQIRTIDKQRLREFVGTISNHKMDRVETAIWSSFYQPDRKGAQNDAEQTILQCGRNPANHGNQPRKRLRPCKKQRFSHHSRRRKNFSPSGAVQKVG